MAPHRWILVAAAAVAATFVVWGGTARDSQTLTPGRRAEVEASVRKFALQVAQDVIEEGPMIWRKHFADTPSFFMVVNGRLEFANSQAATQGDSGRSPEIPECYVALGRRFARGRADAGICGGCGDVSRDTNGRGRPRD